MQNQVLGQTTTQTETPWSQRIANSVLSRYSAEISRWHYKHALMFKGVHHVWEDTGDQRYWGRVKGYVDQYVQPDGSIQTYRQTDYNIDQINPGKLLFPLYEETGDERYRIAIEALREQLRGHPRTNEGGFWHKQIYPYQMWLDGIYMGGPFYAAYGAMFDEPAAFDDVAFQITALEAHTRDPETGLLYHAWDESRAMAWANDETGCSPHFWSRAIGWYTMALVDVLDFYPAEHEARPRFIEILENTLTPVAAYQDSATGLWWQVLDEGDRAGNYLEASGTSMYIYAIAKGVRHGYLDERWLPTATKAFNGLIENLVTVDDEGRIDLHGVCSTAGLGGTPYRDGSFEYYVGEPIETNDLHGTGPFLTAAVELERATAA